MQDTSQTMLITVEEAAQQLRMSRAKTFQLIANEGLPVVRFGKSVRVDPDALREWVKARQQQQ